MDNEQLEDEISRLEGELDSLRISHDRLFESVEKLTALFKIHVENSVERQQHEDSHQAMTW
tara:strand:- start:452 stop:634 length:183 start_codon:yes stop_codon:yes gene_type:complete